MAKLTLISIVAVFQFIGTGAGMSVAMSNPPMINEPSIINEPSMINEPSIINEESINDDQSIINEKVDRSLISIAARIRADGMDRMEVDGFTSQIPLSITGFSMPIDFSLQLGNGMVGDLSEFARLGNATRTSSILRTAVQYRPLTAEYAHMRLTSPISTCDGSLNFKVRPSFNVIVEQNSPTDCKIVSFSLRNSGQLDYDVSTSFFNIFKGIVLRNALQQSDPTPMLTSVVVKAEKSFVQHFEALGCQMF